jgi:hypothetical protein
MALALGGAIALTTIVDILQGDAGAGAEAHHFLDIAGIVLLFVLSRAPAPVPGRSAGATALPA